jgi:hypothetical protein
MPEPINNKTLSGLALSQRGGAMSRLNFGAIARQIQRVSMKTWCIAGAGTIGVGCIGMMMTQIFRQTETAIAPVENNPGILAQAFNPQTLAGITPNTPPDEAVGKLYALVPNYERILSDTAQTHMDEMLKYEAIRLNNEALKEVQESRYVPNDPALDIDLNRCPDKVSQQKCVLLRYAGDGLKWVQEGTIARDAQKVALGYTRYRAALLALYPQEPVPPDSSMVFQGLLNYRLMAYSIIQRLPSADPFATKLDPKLTQQNGASAIESANPVPLPGSGGQ